MGRMLALGLWILMQSLSMTAAWARPAVDLSGVWSTNWGNATLAPVRDGFAGPYENDSGKVHLVYTVDGTFEGQWSEASSAKNCETPASKTGPSTYWGRVSLELSEDGNRLEGAWGYCNDPITAGTWTFRRLSPLPPREPEPEPNPFIGNWIANWDRAGEVPGLMSVYRDFRWDCISAADAWCQKIEASPESILLSGGQMGENTTKQANGTLSFPKPGQMDVRWNYGFLGYWGGASQLEPGSPANLSGTWSYADVENGERWNRVFAKPRLVAKGEFLDGGGLRLLGGPIGSPITLETEYRSATYSMRGNRASVQLFVLGENMWGIHDYSVPKNSGLELRSMHYLCRDKLRVGASAKNRACTGNGGVVGAMFDLVVWEEARSGMNFLTYDGLEIPFFLRVNGAPTDPDEEEPGPTEIKKLVLLDDQLAQRAKPGDSLKDYRYPFDPQGQPTSGEASRLLVVIGKNLTRNGRSFLTSPDARVSYREELLSPNILAVARQSASELSGLTLTDEDEILAVRAHLKPKVEPGVKELNLNGAKGAWPLAFADQIVTLDFLRKGAQPGDLRETTFYHGEVIQAGLLSRSPGMPLDGLWLQLEAKAEPTERNPNPKARPLARLKLGQILDSDPRTPGAISKRFTVAHKRGPNLSAEANKYPVYRLDPKERLVIRLEDPLAAFPIPPQRSAKIEKAPPKKDIWQDALNKVAACRGVGGDPTSSTFAGEKSAEFSNWILTDAVYNRWQEGTLNPQRSATRTIRLNKGDHAALILLRNELVPLVEAENKKLQPYMGNGQAGQTRAMRYYNLHAGSAASAQMAFWQRREDLIRVEVSNILNPPRVPSANFDRPISVALDFEGFRRLIKDPNADELPKVVKTRDRINELVLDHLKQQHRETKAAISRAKKAGNCNIEELLVLAGQDQGPALNALYAKLVREENGQWVPIAQGRNYVRTVAQLAQAVRAQQEYASIDNAYKSMAVALVAAPVAYAGSSLAATGGAVSSAAGQALTYTAVAADLFDMAYFGSEGVADYLKGEKDYYTAMGLAPVLGPEAIKDAEARRQNPVLAGVGVLAPALSLKGGLSAIDDIGKARRGRLLMQGDDGLKRFDELSETQREELAAYYKHLHEAQASRTVRFSKTDAEDLADLESLIQSRLAGSSAEAAREGSLAAKPLSALEEGQLSTIAVPPPVSPQAAELPAEDSFFELFGKGVKVEEAPKRGPPGGSDQFRNAETSLRLDEAWDMGPDTRYAQPFEDDFSGPIVSSDGTLLSSINPQSKNLDAGAQFQLSDGTNITLGEQVGAGGFKRVFVDPEDPQGAVYKVISFDAAADRRMDEELLNGYFLDNNVGRELLQQVEAQGNQELMRVAGQLTDPVVIDDPFSGSRFAISREQNIQSQIQYTDPNGNLQTATVSNAAERFSWRTTGRANEAENLTIQLAIRKLNDEGIIWTDHKLANLDVVPNKNSPTGYQVIMFDHDGMRIAEGATAAERAANARATQRVFDSTPAARSPYDIMAENGMADFDPTIFTREVPWLSSPGANVGRTEYLRLDQLSTAEFQAELNRFNQATGRNVQYEPARY